MRPIFLYILAVYFRHVNQIFLITFHFTATHGSPQCTSERQDAERQRR